MLPLMKEGAYQRVILSLIRMSRSEVMDKLKEDIINYFGYSDWLAERILHMFPPAEVIICVNLSEL